MTTEAKGLTLDEALDFVQVDDVDFERNPGCDTIKDWHRVSTDDDGVVAYFADERDAYRYRLFLINELCNPR